ncbi:hypothetical protein CJ231_07425 [Hoylesella buccalis]|uniref:Uncharacterized protein n=1 Tax=Hoylesella buccalis TaxID=28127 RepID=A0A2N6QQP6_9BACT|nr:hypothetical protein CJ231_07425 [Hoylesella buccalis]
MYMLLPLYLHQIEGPFASKKGIFSPKHIVFDFALILKIKGVVNNQADKKIPFITSIFTTHEQVG